MFVEKLTIDELVQFITNNELISYSENVDSMYPEYEKMRQIAISRKYDFSNISNYSVKNGKASFNIDSNEFLFTDFDYISPFVIRLIDGIVDKDWIKFMANKFGDEYKAAFLEYRQEQKEKKLKEYAENYDDYTKSYEEELEM